MTHHTTIEADIGTHMTPIPSELVEHLVGNEIEEKTPLDILLGPQKHTTAQRQDGGSIIPAYRCHEGWFCLLASWPVDGCLGGTYLSREAALSLSVLGRTTSPNTPGNINNHIHPFHEEFCAFFSPRGWLCIICSSRRPSHLDGSVSRHDA